MQLLRRIVDFLCTNDFEKMLVSAYIDCPRKKRQFAKNEINLISQFSETLSN